MEELLMVTSIHTIINKKHNVHNCVASRAHLFLRIAIACIDWITQFLTMVPAHWISCLYWSLFHNVHLFQVIQHLIVLPLFLSPFNFHFFLLRRQMLFFPVQVCTPHNFMFQYLEIFVVVFAVYFTGLITILYSRILLLLLMLLLLTNFSVCNKLRILPVFFDLFWCPYHYHS